jgi:hypothetical protein
MPLGEGTWEDPLLGTGGKYGFGWDVKGGYAWGVSNQDPRVGSFYSQQLFDTPMTQTPAQPVVTVLPNGDTRTVYPDGSVQLTRPGGFMVTESPTQGTIALPETAPLTARVNPDGTVTISHDPLPPAQSTTPSWLIPVLVIVGAWLVFKT